MRMILCSSGVRGISAHGQASPMDKNCVMHENDKSQMNEYEKHLKHFYKQQRLLFTTLLRLVITTFVYFSFKKAFFIFCGPCKLS